MAHAPLNRLAARTLALFVLLSGLALPGARPVSATPALAPAKAATAQEIPPPDTLVSENVHGFIAANATVFWFTSCESGQSTSIGSINRIPVQGGESRQLYNAGEACSPSTFRSNIVADADYLYWSSDSALLRLPTNATVGDQPQVLSAAPALNGKLTLDNDALYALHVESIAHPFSDTHIFTATVQRVAKSDGTTTTLITRTGIEHPYYFPRALQVSHAFLGPSSASDYLYWLENRALMRYNLNSGVLDTIASDVYSFYAEGGVTSCENLRCPTTDRVYFSGEKHLSYYNNNDGTTTPVYPNTGLSGVTVTDRRHLFLQRVYTIIDCVRPYWRECPYRLRVQIIRDGREASGKGVVLYDHSIGSSNLTIANGYLLWQYGGMLQRLPTDVGLPHLYMPVIRR